jgi:dipeptidyl aminopeptidase/acylaminoacyl peptidase
MFARHWDHWVTENRNALWLAKLIPKEGGKWELSPLINALKDTALASPVEPFGGGDHFDIGKYGLVFTAKDPSLNPALHTKTNMYFIRFDWVSMDTVPAPEQIQIYGFEGACSSPAFSPDGSSFIFLAMKHDGYESDKNQVFFVPSIHRTSWVIHAFASDDGKGKWDRSPGSIVWSRDYVGDASLYFVADDNGRACLFASKVSQLPTGPIPQMIVKGGGIGGVVPLEHGDLFISSSSLIDNSLYSLLPADRVAGRVYTLPDDTTPENSTSTTKCISSATKHGSMFGLSRRQIDEVHWPGSAHNTSVHAWVIKPSNFDSSKKYPLAYLIHGGPQGAWDDSWSTRWNPAVFAEQGYVVITPNPTGSTGYGQDFTDAIQGQWGGLPYQDLSLGFDWIRSNLGYVDTDRAVGLGASYGGYSMSSVDLLVAVY